MQTQKILVIKSIGSDSVKYGQQSTCGPTANDHARRKSL